MARTRTAGHAGSTQARAGPSHSSNRPSRTTLARRSKPTTFIQDSESDVDDEDDSSIHSESDASDQDSDSGIERTLDELDLQPATPPHRRTSRRTLRKVRTSPKTTTLAKKFTRTTRTAKKASQSVKTLSPRKHPTESSSNKRRHNGSQASPSKKAKMSLNEESQIPTGFIPDWLSAQIPFDAWVDIFSYASNHGDDSGWLVHAATTCKAFTEPVLNVLYHQPAIKTASKAKKLQNLLLLDHDKVLFNYCAKIKTLHINFEVVSANLALLLVHRLSRLSEIIFFSTLDQPPYRDLDKPTRRGYHGIFDGLFGGVTGSPPQNTLKSWEWSGRFLSGFVQDVYAILPIHQRPHFSQLTRVSYTNFQVPSLHSQVKPNDEESMRTLDEEDGKIIDAIAEGIAELKHLKHLVFESSTVMNHRLLPLLPKDLVHLELINCWEVKSDDFQAFLRTHGRNIRVLNLQHNQSLDLAFLTDLAETCPKLRELRMNLSYYRHHESVNDSGPMYDQALLPDEKPSWPRTLRVIDMVNISHWSAEAASMFLQSLIDSACNLPDLRHLAIKTMLDDISWQTRAHMRLEWRNKMERVFLRPWVAPRVHTTLRPETLLEAAPLQKRRKIEASQPSRRSGRIAATSDSDPQTSNSRLRGSQRPLYRDPDTDEDDFSESDHFSESVEANTQDDLQEELPQEFIQGLCQTVSVLFDNQKPREMQYGMEDFNDEESESSGDEWDGDVDDGDDAVYAF